MDRLKAVVKFVGWNLGLIVVVVVAAELIFGGWFRAPGMWNFAFYRDKDWWLDVETHYDNDRQPIHYVRDYFGLRGSFGTPDTVNILALGGSTTDERFVTEGKTWPDVLGQCLRDAGKPAAVANAGVTGQTLRGNARNFDLWLNHIPELRPRYVVTLFGINELFIEALGDKDDIRRFTEAVYPHDVMKSVRQWIKMNSALVQLGRVIRGNIVAFQEGIAVKPNLKVLGGSEPTEHGVERIDRAYQTEARKRVEPGDPEFRRRTAEWLEREGPRLGAFRDRLHTLRDTVREFGAIPVFVTQAWGTYRVHPDGSVSGDLDKFFQMHAYYTTAMEFCRETGERCINLGEVVEFQNGDFWDNAHTTPSGSARIGRHVCDNLRNWEAFSLPSATAHGVDGRR